jgi:glycosyltransferase involved in cell wall biosynthesis
VSSGAKPMADEAAPAVSVIIPCYNQAIFLGEAIESVLGQTCRSFEVIVIDDGSPDDTQAVAARYPEVRYLRQPNRGMCPARHLGVDHSSAPNLVFLDADDRLMPDALETGLAALAEHPECAFVYGSFHRISSKGARTKTANPPRKLTGHYQHFLRRNFVSPASIMFRRAVFEEVGRFDSSVDVCADYDIYLRIARSYPVASHRHVVSERRIHDQQATMNFANMLRTVLKVHDRQRRFADLDPELSNAYAEGRLHYKEWYGEQLLTQTHLLLAGGQWGKALPNLATLARHYRDGFSRLCRGLRRSNSIDFHVVKTGGRAPETSAAKTSGPLRIDALTPDKVIAGEKFGETADGRSTLTVTCTGASPRTVVIFDGRALETQFSSETSVRAFVPDDLTSKEGSWPVFLLK